jgi:thiamine biosynthesis lipoprotein
VTFAQATWRALGTTAHLVVADARDLDAVRRAVQAEIDEIDLACSRFRDDSELVALNAAAGRATVVSPVLFEAVEVAVDAARSTGGAVDPTVGAAIVAAGYDRDFDSLLPEGPAENPAPAPGWRAVHADAASRSVRLEDCVQLDLGATAKALAADRAAAAARAVTSDGVLLSLGGDIAVAGPSPDGGWPVALADDHRDPAGGPVVTLCGGGLATSSTTVRRWRRGGRELSHIFNPVTGAACTSIWRTVSVTAGSCLAANVASTASIVLGEDAPSWLARAGLRARLVSREGSVLLLNGWPEDRPA